MRHSLVTSVTAIAIVIVGVASAHAQTRTPKKPGFEFVMPGGATMPVGDQEKDVKRGMVTAAQASYGLRSNLVLTGTFAWTRTRPIGLGAEAKLNLFTYDLGAEFRMPRHSGDRRLSVKPFAGFGVGARSSNYRHVDVATSHQLAAYVSAGGEVRLGRVGFRLEVRDYVIGPNLTRFSGAAQRNDVAVLAGLRLVRR